MPQSCVAPGCRNVGYEKKDICYFVLPANAAKRKLWLNSLKFKNPSSVSKHARVCSEHFEPECFLRDLQAELCGGKARRKLRDDAVPSIFDFSEYQNATVNARALPTRDLPAGRVHDAVVERKKRAAARAQKQFVAEIHNTIDSEMIVQKRYTMPLEIITQHGARPFKYQYFEKMFNVKQSDMQHEVNQTRKNPFKCQYCEKRFSIALSCIQHERTHHGENSFKCQYCDMSFSVRSSCTQHEMIHRRGKPFKCKFCEKGVQFKPRCIQHGRSHSGETPYQCQYCEKSFIVKDQRKRHELIHTGDSLHSLGKEKPHGTEASVQSFKEEIQVEDVAHETKEQRESNTEGIVKREFNDDIAPEVRLELEEIYPVAMFRNVFADAGV
ncbi:zinc finger protein OZF [Lingula anatina]|uniref:Zinc finger protein OZF n=1 Tax=Lingula anatina TaxID=7574 RepID=A0A1S3KFC8_LINAN|nr:zinc finger protein OZF [Lingula anatina]|eukprot:XP_013421192.1 zinc finger protein OZF [Lingula anatina]